MFWGVDPVEGSRSGERRRAFGCSSSDAVRSIKGVPDWAVSSCARWLDSGLPGQDHSLNAGQRLGVHGLQHHRFTLVVTSEFRITGVSGDQFQGGPRLQLRYQLANLASNQGIAAYNGDPGDIRFIQLGAPDVEWDSIGGTCGE